MRPYWILREQPNGMWLVGGSPGDSVWGPARRAAKRMTRAQAIRFAAKERAIPGSEEISVIKVWPKCTCRSCPWHGRRVADREKEET